MSFDKLNLIEFLLYFKITIFIMKYFVFLLFNIIWKIVFNYDLYMYRLRIINNTVVDIINSPAVSIINLKIHQRLNTNTLSPITQKQIYELFNGAERFKKVFICYISNILVYNIII